MYGICCFYNFKLFKACGFLTAFCGCLELYIYSTNTLPAEPDTCGA